VTPKPVVRDGTGKGASDDARHDSCDHRVIDGATGARFLKPLSGCLENPLLDDCLKRIAHFDRGGRPRILRSSLSTHVGKWPISASCFNCLPSTGLVALTRRRAAIAFVILQRTVAAAQQIRKVIRHASPLRLASELCSTSSFFVKGLSLRPYHATLLGTTIPIFTLFRCQHRAWL